MLNSIKTKKLTKKKKNEYDMRENFMLICINTFWQIRANFIQMRFQTKYYYMFSLKKNI